MRKTNAVVVLVLGIVSLLGPGCLAGIPAWIMGNNTIREIDTLGGSPDDRTLAVIGKTLGMVTTLLSLAGVMIVIFLQFVMGVILIGSSQTHQTYDTSAPSTYSQPAPSGGD